MNNDQICAAIKYIYETNRTIVEPAGALGTAGVLAYAEQHRLQGKTMVSICSGANIAFERLQFIAERTLLGSGRELLFSVQLPEQPGALAEFCNSVVNGHNITESSYRLADREHAYVLIGITVDGQKDKDNFVAKLQTREYTFRDLSDDDIAKEHLRHMVGGVSQHAHDEQFYEVSFPERPRALADFLKNIGASWNISLFHYRGQGGDIGRVLIGFEAADHAALYERLQASGYDSVQIPPSSTTPFL